MTDRTDNWADRPADQADDLRYDRDGDGNVSFGERVRGAFDDLIHGDDQTRRDDVVDAPAADRDRDGDVGLDDTVGGAVDRAISTDDPNRNNVGDGVDDNRDWDRGAAAAATHAVAGGAAATSVDRDRDGDVGLGDRVGTAVDRAISTDDPNRNNVGDGVDDNRDWDRGRTDAGGADPVGGGYRDEEPELVERQLQMNPGPRTEDVDDADLTAEQERINPGPNSSDV
ncbi:MAG: hypothetical protein HZY73_04685 [Micropruina sp.]|nr:MAG: hypothetical protein HZY73_04685 [Micropruina sp.]